MKKTLYRADDYYRNFGDIVGFYESKKQAEVDIKYRKRSNGADGNFSQITKFQVVAEEEINTEDHDQMMRLWEEGAIIDTYFYV